MDKRAMFIIKGIIRVKGESGVDHWREPRYRKGYRAGICRGGSGGGMRAGGLNRVKVQRQSE